MGKITVDQNHDYATTIGSQTTGVFDRIMEINPPEGIELGLEDRTPLVFKLYQSGGTEILGSSAEVQVAWIKNSMSVRDGIYTASYMPWSKYTYTEQTGKDHIDRLRIDMSDFLEDNFGSGKDTFVINEEEYLLIYLKADNQVSFSPTGETTHIEVPLIENP